MSKPTCAVSVIFNIKPEHAAAFHQAVILQAENSLSKEAWCHQFDVGTTPERAHCFLLYETYDDRDAFVNKHRQTDHFAAFNRTVADWIESKEVNVWDIG